MKTEFITNVQTLDGLNVTFFAHEFYFGGDRLAGGKHVVSYEGKRKWAFDDPRTVLLRGWAEIMTADEFRRAVKLAKGAVENQMASPAEYLWNKLEGRKLQVLKKGTFFWKESA